jgi:hypothetical protein
MMSRFSFATLLSGTSATLPSTDPELEAFLAIHHAVVAAGTTANAKLEFASGLRWLQTLSAEDDGDVARVASLPPAAKKKVATFLGIDKPDTTGWPKLAIRRSHAFMAGGQSPAKKPRRADHRAAGDGRRHRARSSSPHARSPPRSPSSSPAPRPSRSRGVRDRVRARSRGRRSASPLDSDVDLVEEDSPRPSRSGVRHRARTDVVQGEEGSPRSSRSDSRRRAGSAGGRYPRKAAGRHRSSPDSGHRRRGQRRSRDSPARGGRRGSSSDSSQSARHRRKGRRSCRERDDDPSSFDDSDGSSGDSSGSDSGYYSAGSGGRRRRRSPASRTGGSSRSRAGGNSSSRAGGSSRGSGRARALLLDLQSDDHSEVLRLTSREWLRGADLQASLPARWYAILNRQQDMQTKEKTLYERSLKSSRKAGETRTESVLKPSWVHRLAFVWAEDDMLRCLGTNLGLAARGESAALYATGTTDSLRDRQLFQTFQAELRLRYQACIDSLEDGHCLSDVERTSFSGVFVQGFERRYALIKKEVGLSSRAAIEVVSNSARQLAEIRTLIAAAWTDYASRAASLSRDDQVEFYRERFAVVFDPAVRVFLGVSLGLASGDPFGPAPGRAGASASRPDLSAASRRLAPPLTQIDGGTTARPQSPRPKPPAAAGAQAVSGLPAAQSWPPLVQASPTWPLSWMPPFGPGFSLGAPGVGHAPPPPLPPPPYAPPAIKPEPTAAASGRSATTKQVQFASPPVTPSAGAPGRAPAKGGTASDRAADGLDSFYPSGAAFVGKSACAYLSGLRSVRGIPGPVPGPPCHSERCKSVGAGPHPTWNCPLRFFSVRGACPGFLPSGARDPAAWVGDEITDATRAQWRDFDATLRLAAGASGLPSFA